MAGKKCHGLHSCRAVIIQQRELSTAMPVKGAETVPLDLPALAPCNINGRDSRQTSSALLMLAGKP
jgi:hypothetical protein